MVTSNFLVQYSADTCLQISSYNRLILQLVGTVNRSGDLRFVIARHNPLANGIWTRFGGGNKERIFTLKTGIYLKSSRGESIYPKSW